ncbi:hypothetical protein D9M73_127890 [compost metagenome]
MGIGGDLCVERFVVGGGNDQPATVQIRLGVATQQALATAAGNQLAQLRFDFRCNHPQQRTGIGQQAGFAQGNLPPADDQHTTAAKVVKQRQIVHLADDLKATHVGLEDFRHTDGTVGLLIVLQHRHQGATHCQA